MGLGVRLLVVLGLVLVLFLGLFKDFVIGWLRFNCLEDGCKLNGKNQMAM